MIAAGMIWIDSGAYIPGYGRIEVLEVDQAHVTFKYVRGMSGTTWRHEMALDQFKQRFRRVS